MGNAGGLMRGVSGSTATLLTDCRLYLIYARVMSQPHDPRYYREQAARYREKAAATLDSAELRDSYVGLAVSYARLADTLEKRSLLQRSPPDETAPGC